MSLRALLFRFYVLPVLPSWLRSACPWRCYCCSPQSWPQHVRRPFIAGGENSLMVVDAGCYTWLWATLHRRHKCLSPSLHRVSAWGMSQFGCCGVIVNVQT